MKPQTIGRVLGFGVRVAGKMAGQALNGPNRPTAPVTVAGGGGPGVTRATGRQAGRASRGVVKGVGGFLRPFGRVGGKIFQEVTGVFFLLFVLVFSDWVWKTRGSWMQGPEHTKFLSYAGLTLVFLYLSLSSFWRARRR